MRTETRLDMEALMAIGQVRHHLDREKWAWGGKGCLEDKEDRSIPISLVFSDNRIDWYKDGPFLTKQVPYRTLTH